jgi:undecaprenyl-diphosphatase
LSALAQAGRHLQALGKASVRLAGGDVRLLAGALLTVTLIWGFVHIAGEVAEGDTQRFDEKIMLLLRHPDDIRQPRGPAWLPGAMRDIPALGSPPVMILFTLAVVVALAVRGQYHAVALVLGATLSGRFLNMYLKAFFARPRPDLALHLTEVRTASFPSGHAMESAIIYLTLAALLARLVVPRALKLYIVGVALFLSFLVGLSRVYLGVHYPTDVLAGWMAGLAWAVLCWGIATYLQRRGTVERAN